MQLSFIETEEEYLQRELHDTKEKIASLRRSFFSRYDKLICEISLLRQELEELKLAQGIKSEPPEIFLFPEVPQAQNQ